MEQSYNSINLDKTYYWILATDRESGRAIILGAYDTEDEANRVGFEKIDDSFEVVPLNTRDSGRATKMLKYRRFDQTAKLEDAIKRARHQV